MAAAGRMAWVKTSVMGSLLMILSLLNFVKYIFKGKSAVLPPGSATANDFVLQFAKPAPPAKSDKKAEGTPSSDAAAAGSSESKADDVDTDAGCCAKGAKPTAEQVAKLHAAVQELLESPAAYLKCQSVKSHPHAAKGANEVLIGVTANEATLALRAEAVQMIRTLSDRAGGGFRPFAVASADEFEKRGIAVQPEDSTVKVPTPMFSSGERVRLVWGILHELKAGEEVGKLLGCKPTKPLVKALEESGQLKACFPLHNQTERQLLEKVWVRTLQSQPLNLVKEYMGETVAMYFSFVGFYTSSLAVPAVLGVVAHYYQTVNGLSSQVTLAYSAFIMAWATLFLERWKRQQSTNAFHWHTLDYLVEEEEPPEFTKSPTTGHWIPRVTAMTRTYRSVVSPVVVLAMIGVSCMAMWWTEVFTEYIRLVFEEEIPEGEGIREWVSAAPAIVQRLVMHSPLIVYGLSIPALDHIFTIVATKLTKLEQRETPARHQSSLVLKLILFQFLNNFMSLFYLAFGLGDLQRLRWRLGVLMVVRQLLDNFLEVGLPAIKSRLRLSSAAGSKATEAAKAKLQQNNKKKEKKKKGSSGEAGKAAASEEAEAAGVLYQEEAEIGLENISGTYDDMLELFIQYGHVVLFAAAFPLAALCAALNNVMEIRTDAFKLCSARRPVPSRAANIGAWALAFELLGYLSVLTNCCLIAMATDNLHSWLPEYDTAARILWLVVIEHVLIALKLLIDAAIPDVPAAVRLQLQLIEEAASDSGSAASGKKVHAGALVVDEQELAAGDASDAAGSGEGEGGGAGAAAAPGSGWATLLGMQEQHDPRLKMLAASRMQRTDSFTKRAQQVSSALTAVSALKHAGAQAAARRAEGGGEGSGDGDDETLCARCRGEVDQAGTSLDTLTSGAQAEQLSVGLAQDDADAAGKALAAARKRLKKRVHSLGSLASRVASCQQWLCCSLVLLLLLPVLSVYLTVVAIPAASAACDAMAGVEAVPAAVHEWCLLANSSTPT